MKTGVLLRLFTFLILFLMGAAAFGDDLANTPNPIPLSPAPLTQEPTDPIDKAIAEADDEAPAKSKGTRSVQVGLGYFNYNYREELPAPLKSTENAIIPNIDIVLQATSESGCFVRGILDLGIGNTIYVGTDSAGNPLTATTQNIMFNLEFDFGMPFYKGETGTFSGYFGLGDSLWRRDLSAYREEYSWLFLPVGVRYDAKLGPKLEFSADLAAKIPFHGSIKAYLSDISPNYSDGSGLLGTDRIGVRLQLPITYRSEAFLKWIVTPWFEYSGFTRGTDFPVEDNNGNPIVLNGDAQIAHEPPSQTYRFGLLFSGEYQF